MNGGEVTSDLRSGRPGLRASGSDEEQGVSVSNGAVHPTGCQSVICDLCLLRRVISFFPLVSQYRHGFDGNYVCEEEWMRIMKMRSAPLSVSQH